MLLVEAMLLELLEPEGKVLSIAGLLKNVGPLFNMSFPELG